MNLRERFEALDALLDTPEKWSNGGGLAETAAGKCINYNDPQAVRWCVVGGVFKVVAGLSNVNKAKARQEMIRVFWEVLPTIGYKETIGYYNDDATFSQIKDLIKRCIDFCSEKEHVGAG